MINQILWYLAIGSVVSLAICLWLNHRAKIEERSDVKKRYFTRNEREMVLNCFNVPAIVFRMFIMFMVLYPVIIVGTIILSIQSYM